MTDIVAFLTARLDEDEQIALAATFQGTHPHGNHWQWGEAGRVPAPVVRDGYLRSNGGLSYTVSLVTVETYDAQGMSTQYPAEVLHSASRVHAEAAEHIARHDPARVLADVAAKRRILELHQFSSRPERWGDLRWPADADTPAARDRAYGELTGGAVYSCATCDGFDREEERVVRADPWCDTLLALVAAYAEHPDYNESWRP